MGDLRQPAVICASGRDRLRSGKQCLSITYYIHLAYLVLLASGTEWQFPAVIKSNRMFLQLHTKYGYGRSQMEPSYHNGNVTAYLELHSALACHLE
jgi:hypothetical protein